MKIRTVLLVIISILLGICLLIGSSYAFYTGSITSTNKLQSTLALSQCYTITGSGPDVSLNITPASMYAPTQTRVAGYTTSNYTVTMTPTTSASCTYDLYWVWDTSTSYTKTSGVSKEFTVLIGSTEYNLPSSSTKETKLLSTSISQTSATAKSVKTDYTLRVYNDITKNQSGIANKTFKGHISAKNFVCTCS